MDKSNKKKKQVHIATACRRQLRHTWATVCGLDYRHWILIIGLLLSAGMFFTVFRLTADRFRGAVSDFSSAFDYYIRYVLQLDYIGDVTVREMPEVDLRSVCPFDLDDILRKFDGLGKALLSKEMFAQYISATGWIAYKIAFYLLMFFPLVLLAWILIHHAIFRENTNHTDSRPLRFWQSRIRPIIGRVLAWLRDFRQFASEKGYGFAYVIVWAFNFNLVTVFIEFYAWYFAMAAELDFSFLGVNLQRLFVDLLITFWSAPWPFWAVVAWLVFIDIREGIGVDILRHHEAQNAGFFGDLPVVSLVVGTMGLGKTTCITDMGLTGQNYYRRKAKEMLFAITVKFPAFPWQRLEDALSYAINAKAVYNWSTVSDFVHRKKRQYEDHPEPHRLYHYHPDRDGKIYDDGLGLTDLWAAIESYARLYFMYALDTTLITSNYAVRDDADRLSIGNFVAWDDDFFSGDRRPGRYAHIIDMDMLRTGKLKDPDNPHKGSKEFGVDLLSEMGKERGNAVENKGMKKDDPDANPLNDGFNIRLKMHRHGAVTENYCFAKIIGDEQREESLGADARDLCTIVKIQERSEVKLAMPFYALGMLLYGLLYERVRNTYFQLRYLRGDRTLIGHWVKSVFVWFFRRHTKIINRFGYSVLTLAMQSGTGDGEVSTSKYYLANAKIYSKRFKTDCYGDLFAKQASKSNCGLMDLQAYAGIQATEEELAAQHSYFMDSILDQFGTR